MDDDRDGLANIATVSPRTQIITGRSLSYGEYLEHAAYRLSTGALLAPKCETGCKRSYIGDIYEVQTTKKGDTARAAIIYKGTIKKSYTLTIFALYFYFRMDTRNPYEASNSETRFQGNIPC